MDSSSVVGLYSSSKGLANHCSIRVDSGSRRSGGGTPTLLFVKTTASQEDPAGKEVEDTGGTVLGEPSEKSTADSASTDFPSRQPSPRQHTDIL